VITLLIATRNAHKLDEIRGILGRGFFYRTFYDPTAAPVKEDATTFAGNATKKAVELARRLHSLSDTERQAIAAPPCFVLADDSGLEVDALNGAPGVHSARFAALDPGIAANSTDTQNNEKLLRLLKDVPLEKRTARFRCVLALAPAIIPHQEVASPVCYADEVEWQVELFDGACEGRILFAPKGTAGFGYDPLFVPAGYDRTFAELGEEEKNRLSHRAEALGKLKRRLQTIRESK
jgi:XTP/dITP diphosphohydrolase